MQAVLRVIPMKTSDEYLYIESGDIQVHVKQQHDGVVVDIFPKEIGDDFDEALESTYALYSEAPNGELVNIEHNNTNRETVNVEGGQDVSVYAGNLNVFISMLNGNVDVVIKPSVLDEDWDDVISSIHYDGQGNDLSI